MKKLYHEDIYLDWPLRGRLTKVARAHYEDRSAGLIHRNLYTKLLGALDRLIHHEELR